MKRNNRRWLRALVCLALMTALTAAASHYEKRPDYYVAAGKFIPVSTALDAGSVTRAAGRFRYLNDNYLAPNHIKPYIAIVPDKGCYLPNRGELDYASLFSQTYAQMEYAEPIDLTGALSADSYYATDSHWRQECLVGVADTLVRAMTAQEDARHTVGKEERTMTAQETAAAADGKLLTLEDYTVRLASDSYTGSDWQAVYSAGLPMGQNFSQVRPESLYYLDSELLQQLTVYNYDTQKNTGVFGNEAPANGNLYNLFLSGPTALLAITNPASANTRKLIMFRDSYGSSLAALLAPYYQQILVVDIRYTMSERLGEQIDFSEWTGADALFIYSTTLLNRSISLR